MATSEQTSNLLGLTWRWSLGSGSQLRNALYYRSSDKNSSQGESYPDLAGPAPTTQNTPVRPDILRLAENEKEYGWRTDLSTVLSNGDVVSAGARLSRIEIDFERALAGDWIRYVYDASDDRPDPSQRYIVLTADGVDSQLRAEATRYVFYADYSHAFGAVTVTPGLRFQHDGFADQSMLSPRLVATWQIDDASRAWMGGGVYYQAPRYLRKDLQLTAEAYHQRLSHLLVFDDRTTQIAAVSARIEETLSVSSSGATLPGAA